MVVIVLLFATAYYFLSGFKNDISNEQVGNLPTATQKEVVVPNTDTFTDEQGVFSFRYPKGATVTLSKSPTEAGGITVEVRNKKWVELNSWGMTLTALPMASPPNLSLGDYNKNPNYSDVKWGTLGGERGIVYLRNNGGDVSPTRIIEVTHGRLFYTVGVGASNNTNEMNQIVDSTFNTIVGTFGFIK